MGLSGVNSPLPVGTDFDVVMIDKLFGWQFISSLKVGALLLICCNQMKSGFRGTFHPFIEGDFYPPWPEELKAEAV